MGDEVSVPESLQTWQLVHANLFQAHQPQARNPQCPALDKQRAQHTLTLHNPEELGVTVIPQ